MIEQDKAPTGAGRGGSCTVKTESSAVRTAGRFGAHLVQGREQSCVVSCRFFWRREAEGARFFAAHQIRYLQLYAVQCGGLTLEGKRLSILLNGRNCFYKDRSSIPVLCALRRVVSESPNLCSEATYSRLDRHTDPSEQQEQQSGPICIVIVR